jgi:hypothetical protein
MTAAPLFLRKRATAIPVTPRPTTTMFFCDNSIIQKIRLSFADIICLYFQSGRPALAGRRAGPVQEQGRSDIGFNRSKVWIKQRTAEYRISNIECRRVESLRSTFLNI